MSSLEDYPKLVSVQSLASRWSISGREIRSACKRLGIKVYELKTAKSVVYRISVKDLPKLCHPEPTAQQVQDRRQAVVRLAAATVARSRPRGVVAPPRGSSAASAGGSGAP